MSENPSGKDVVSVQKVGGALQVSLPFEYARSNGIEKGSKMMVHFDGDRITYKPLPLKDLAPVR